MYELLRVPLNKDQLQKDPGKGHHFELCKPVCACFVPFVCVSSRFR